MKKSPLISFAIGAGLIIAGGTLADLTNMIALAGSLVALGVICIMASIIRYGDQIEFKNCSVHTEIRFASETCPVCVAHELLRQKAKRIGELELEIEAESYYEGIVEAAAKCLRRSN